MDKEERMCSIGDGEKHYSKGLCYAHYQRLMTQGVDMDKVGDDGSILGVGKAKVKELIVPAKPKHGTDLWHTSMLSACMDYFSPVQIEYKYLKERLEAHLQNIEQEG